MSKVLIVMGSDSDWGKMKDCVVTLKELGISPEVKICSAHRTPEQAAELSKNAKDNGFSAIIAAAGLAAHLPGVMAAFSTLPVIGVPISAGPLAGEDALHSIAQMPPGVPVATVAIDGSKNAAILAGQIIAGFDTKVAVKLALLKEEMQDKVKVKQQKLDKILEEEL
ncbi:5-(carboxyamino)imidazole ribonucleotide mutase [Proteinivorax tanatarense]|uniref:N5-carboxyaminoimidazole ribonucleotide mutase n=1 Tax=Proteinivorax tanatarense TaxID=1260629 RepID=A0AAU7VKC1_9FIRM